MRTGVMLLGGKAARAEKVGEKVGEKGIEGHGRTEIRGDHTPCCSIWAYAQLLGYTLQSSAANA